MAARDAPARGKPGFASSPAPCQLRIAALPDPGDPAGSHVRQGADVGILGIDLGTRRRNRENGVLAQVDGAGLLVGVHQSSGNCPKYIHVRQLAPVERERGGVEAFGAKLPPDAVRLVAACETMFVASASGSTALALARGLDISHRGGAAGFLRLGGNVITVPDYPANRYFNNLGNLLLEPRAALVMVDFPAAPCCNCKAWPKSHGMGMARRRIRRPSAPGSFTSFADGSGMRPCPSEKPELSPAEYARRAARRLTTEMRAGPNPVTLLPLPGPSTCIAI